MSRPEPIAVWIRREWAGLPSMGAEVHVMRWALDYILRRDQRQMRGQSASAPSSVGPSLATSSIADITKPVAV